MGHLDLLNLNLKAGMPSMSSRMQRSIYVGYQGVLEHIEWVDDGSAGVVYCCSLGTSSLSGGHQLCN